MSNLRQLIGFFRGAHTAYPEKHVTLSQFYDAVRKPHYALKDRITSIRGLAEHRAFLKERLSEADSPDAENLEEELRKLKDKLDGLKVQLHAYTLSAEFVESGARHIENVKRYTCRIQVDLDLYAPITKCCELRDRLGADPHIEAAFISPSGTGVKAVMLVPFFDLEKMSLDARRNEHARRFTAMATYIKKTYDLDVDDKAKSLSHLCFLSWDPDLKLNPDAVALDLEMWAPVKSEEKPKGKTLFDAAAHNPQDSPRYDNEDPSELCAELLGWIEGADDYKQWVDIGHSVKQWLGDAGFNLWDRWSAQSAKYDSAEASKKWSRLNPSGEMNGKAKLLTLAQQNGWSRKAQHEKAESTG